MSTNVLSIWAPKAYRLPLILGTTAALLGASFVLVHWSVALIAGPAILLLSAYENEPVLLGTIFLIPVGWSAEMGTPLGGTDPRMDIATAVRLIVVAGFFLGQIWRGELDVRELLKPSLTRLSLLFAAVAFASSIFAPSGHTYGSLRSGVRLFSYIAFYLFIAAWARSRERIKAVVFTILCSTILVAAFGIFQEIIGDYTSFWLFLNPPTAAFLPMEGRPPSLLNYCNSLAGYLNLVMPFALGLYLLGRGRTKKLCAWTVFLGFLVLVCTQSAGGLVAFGTVLVLTIIYFVHPLTKKILLIAGVLVLSVAFYGARTILNPAHAGDSVGSDAVGRFLLWGTALEMFRHSPVLGVGWGNFVELYGPYVSAYSSIVPPDILAVHNIYLQLLAETGVLGLAAFLALAYRASELSIRTFKSSADAFDKALAFGVLGATLTIFVHGFVDFLFQASPGFGTLFWTLLALLATGITLQRDSTTRRSSQQAGVNLPL